MIVIQIKWATSLVIIDNIITENGVLTCIMWSRLRFLLMIRREWGLLRSLFLRF